MTAEAVKRSQVWPLQASPQVIARFDQSWKAHNFVDKRGRGWVEARPDETFPASPWAVLE